MTARLLLLLLACISPACEKGLRSGWGSRVIEWSESRVGEPSLPGIDRASVNIGTFGDEPAVIFWSDAGGSMESGWDKSAGAARFRARLRGGQVDVDAVALTADGHSGKVEIGDQGYALSDGRVFLISTQSRPLRSIQLKRQSLPLSEEELRELSRNDPEIRNFFQVASPPEEKPAAASAE